MATCTCEKLADGGDAQSAAAAPTERRELDARTSDALHVRLLWGPITDRVTVTVADSRTGVEFEIPVGDDENPLDVCSPTPTKTKSRVTPRRTTRDETSVKRHQTVPQATRPESLCEAGSRNANRGRRNDEDRN